MIERKSINLCLLALLFLIIQTFTGCSDETIKIEVENEELNLSEEVKSIGLKHNEGLEFVFDEIMKATIESISTKGMNFKSSGELDYMSIVKESTIKFCQKQKLSHPKSINLEELFEMNSTLKSSQDSDFVEGLMSESQKKHWNKIKSLVSNVQTDNNIGRYREELNKIILEATDELTNEELLPMLSAISTLYSTYTYWNEKSVDWYVLLNFKQVLLEYNKAHPNNPIAFDRNSTFKSNLPVFAIFDQLTDWVHCVYSGWNYFWGTYGYEVLLADGFGAIQGAYVAFQSSIGGLTFGPGGLVLVLGGAVIGNAVYASAAGIITLLIVN